MFFSTHHFVQSEAHPAYYPWSTRGSFPGGETDHSPPCRAEVKEWLAEEAYSTLHIINCYEEF
jgi:hypothetical protein